MRNSAVPDVAGRPLASRFEALAELLGAALTPERFLSEHFDRQSVLLQRTARARPLDDAPLTLDEMDELLVRASLPGTSAELLIFQDLKHVTEYATPHLAYASGASLIINRVDKLWPRVHELCARLARDFRYAYGNVYLTPPGSQTVPPHSDDHDVFIVQLHGTKHWLVWPTVHPLSQRRPFADEQAGKDGRRLPDGTSRLTLETLGPPELDVLLRPGDVLYIPRGVVHLIEPEPEWPPTDLRRIAQSVPMPGGPGMLTYMHAPAGLFALSELAARDDLLRVCAARSLFGLGVVSRAVD
eukprot:jgi/Chrpa1/2292/Chrysochromulina_OHIO_Genome00011864-RA